MRIEADPQTHRQLKQKFGWAIGWGIGCVAKTSDSLVKVAIVPTA